jgi:hypothetical protein
MEGIIFCYRKERDAGGSTEDKRRRSTKDMKMFLLEKGWGFASPSRKKVAINGPFFPDPDPVRPGPSSWI